MESFLWSDPVTKRLTIDPLGGEILRLGEAPLTDGGVSDSAGVSVDACRRYLFTLDDVALLSRPKLLLVSLVALVSRMEEARPRPE